MRRILSLVLPYLSTERAWRDDAPADNAQRPLVLTRSVGASLVVAQVCPAARRLGVRPGLSLGQAQAIAPALVAQPYAPLQDQTTLCRLADWAIRFSPIVEAVEPNVLLVDITGCALLFGGEENIAHQAVTGLAQQGFRARAAIADTVGAACALASAGTDRQIIVPPGQGSAYLAPLPPAALRIDPRTAQQLDTLGVRTIGDLLTLPRHTLPARFGRALVRRLQQALGETFEGVSPHRPDDPPRAGRAFDGPLADRATILAVAERLLVDVFAQVQQAEAALRRLQCVLYFEERAPLVLSIALARASRAPAHVAGLLAQRLEAVDLSAGITGLVLVARDTSHYRGRQGALFEPFEPGDDEALGCLLDRLASRLGYEAIVRPRLVDDHQPEMAFRYLPVAEAGSAPEPDLGPATSENSESVGGPAPAMAPRWHRRPVRLFSRPVPIRVIALVPDGPPTWLAYRGVEHTIVHATGPERIETGWWRGPDVRRDYFRVLVESGAQWWVYRHPGRGQWYLHGVFA